MSKTILMTGAAGFIGGHLFNEFIRRGDKVLVLSTHIEKAREKLPDASQIIDLDDYLSLRDEKIDVIINTAGRNVGDKRWNDDFKKEIYNSRIETTRKMVELISAMKHKPDVLVNSSGIDYYGDTGSRVTDESSPPGDIFLAKVCVDWEKEAFKAEQYGTRAAALRTGFVLARDAEGLKRLVMPFKFFIGGPIGSGKQYMPWIHIDDVVRIFILAIESNIHGPVNMCSPNPETMKDFSKHIGKALHRPSFITAPALAVKIIAGQMAELILTGRRAIPRKLTDAGYRFKFENAADALKECLSND